MKLSVGSSAMTTAACPCDVPVSQASYTSDTVVQNARDAKITVLSQHSARAEDRHAKFHEFCFHRSVRFTQTSVNVPVPEIVGVK